MKAHNQVFYPNSPLTLIPDLSFYFCLKSYRCSKNYFEDAIDVSQKSRMKIFHNRYQYCHQKTKRILLEYQSHKIKLVFLG